MRSVDVTIPVPADESVSGVLGVPQGFEAGRTAAVIVAHGAGNDMRTPLLVHFSTGLGRAGYLSLRFNFPYKELEIIEGGDHSFVLPKSFKSFEVVVYERILQRTAGWLKQQV
jgi:hypothetical protein